MIFRLLPKALRTDTFFLTFLNETYIQKHGSNPTPSEIRSCLEEILADEFFTCPVLFEARNFRRLGAKVFLYRFAENRLNKTTPRWMGALHGDEIEFIFGKALEPENSRLFSQRQKRISDQLMTFVTNMASEGLEPVLIFFKIIFYYGFQRLQSTGR